MRHQSISYCATPTYKPQLVGETHTSTHLTKYSKKRKAGKRPLLVFRLNKRGLRAYITGADGHTRTAVSARRRHQNSAALQQSVACKRSGAAKLMAGRWVSPAKRQSIERRLKPRRASSMPGDRTQVMLWNHAAQAQTMRQRIAKASSTRRAPQRAG